MTDRIISVLNVIWLRSIFIALAVGVGNRPVLTFAQEFEANERPEFCELCLLIYGSDLVGQSFCIGEMPECDPDNQSSQHGNSDTVMFILAELLF